MQSVIPSFLVSRGSMLILQSYLLLYTIIITFNYLYMYFSHPSSLTRNCPILITRACPVVCTVYFLYISTYSPFIHPFYLHYVDEDVLKLINLYPQAFRICYEDLLYLSLFLTASLGIILLNCTWTCSVVCTMHCAIPQSWHHCSQPTFHLFLQRNVPRIENDKI